LTVATMQTNNRIITVFLLAVVLLTTASCQPNVTSQTFDREGNPVTLPAKVDRVISIGPSNTEILVALGFADKIVAADTWSRGIDGLAEDLPFFDMLAPDCEQIILLEPDIIFVTGMSKAGGVNPYKTASNAGICVLLIPSSSSIAGIKEDVRYIAEVMNAVEQGEEIIADMEQTIDEIAKIGETITDKKTVYVEISAAPFLYSFGRGVFLHEMLEIIGAENILADRNKWLAVSEELILDKNPDVILTSVDYIDKPVEEILSRPGWNKMTAVQNGDVYHIDTNTSSRPSHHIVKTLREMAKAVYPELYLYDSATR